mmetsp:Transcript_9140/g.21453  ORF Transcript_9140/g.21453 Transcript_9140/m.21453 type:complete len:272 (-) Transcript_9140:1242-2057(-)
MMSESFRTPTRSASVSCTTSPAEYTSISAPACTKKEGSECFSHATLRPEQKFILAKRSWMTFGRDGESGGCSVMEWALTSGAPSGTTTPMSSAKSSENCDSFFVYTPSISWRSKCKLPSWKDVWNDTNASCRPTMLTPPTPYEIFRPPSVRRHLAPITLFGETPSNWNSRIETSRETGRCPMLKTKVFGGCTSGSSPSSSSLLSPPGRLLVPIPLPAFDPSRHGTSPTSLEWSQTTPSAVSTMSATSVPCVSSRGTPVMVIFLMSMRRSET